MGDVVYSKLAYERVRRLNIPNETATQIFQINASELRAFFEPPTQIEGFTDADRKAMWRRAVLFKDIAWFSGNQAERLGNTPDSWNFFSIYRYAAVAERPHRHRPVLIVTSVISEDEFGGIVLTGPRLPRCYG